MLGLGDTKVANELIHFVVFICTPPGDLAIPALIEREWVKKPQATKRI